AARVGVTRGVAGARAVLRREGQLDRTRRTGHLVSKGMRVRGHLRDAVHELAAHTQARPRAWGVGRDRGSLLGGGRPPTLAGPAALPPPADGRRGRNNLPVCESRRWV